MSRTTLKAVVTAPVLPGGTFTAPYRDEAQADFTAGQTATIEVYLRKFDCAISFGASEATITWPAGAPYNLPAGEYYVGLDLVGGDPLPRDAAQATTQADSTAGNVANSTATTVDGAVADLNTLTAAHNALVTEHNALLAKLRQAGLMEAS